MFNSIGKMLQVILCKNNNPSSDHVCLVYESLRKHKLESILIFNLCYVLEIMTLLHSYRGALCALYALTLVSSGDRIECQCDIYMYIICVQHHVLAQGLHRLATTLVSNVCHL